MYAYDNRFQGGENWVVKVGESLEEKSFTNYIEFIQIFFKKWVWIVCIFHVQGRGFLVSKVGETAKRFGWYWQGPVGPSTGGMEGVTW